MPALERKTDEPGLVSGGSAEEFERAAIRLARQAERVKELFRRAPAMLHSIDAEAKILDVSDRWLEVMGYRREEVEGRPLIDFLTPESGRLAREVNLPKFFLEGSCHDIPYQMVTRGGRLMDVLISATSETDQQGKFLYSLALVSDVTPLKEAQRQALDNEKRLLMAVENLPVMVSAFDREGRLVLWNRECRRVTGFTAEEMRADPGVMPKPNPEPGTPGAEWNPGGPEEYLPDRPLEVSLTCKDGRTRNILWFDMSGKVEVPGWGTWMAGIDVTRLKTAQTARLELEKKLLETQRLESLGLAAGGVAHDFNNLLSGIFGEVELGLAEGGEDCSPLDNLRQIGKIARRMAELTSQLLAYCGRGAVDKRPVNLSRAVERMLPLIRAGKQKKADLLLNLAAGPPPIAADPGQINQIILNLVTNAAESLAEGRGRVEIATGAMDCEAGYLSGSVLSFCPLPGRYAWLEVRDDGSGILPEDRTRIFDPFFTTKFTGRGLGLAAVSGIVREAGGAILLNSEPGRGSTFRVLWPVMREVEKIQETEALSEMASTSGMAVVKGTALVVDDESHVLEVVSRQLAAWGLHVEAAGDGPSALETYERLQKDLDVVLLDLAMPGMDGADVMCELRKRGCKAPVVLMSGRGALEDTAHWPEHPTAFLMKPHHSNDLLMILNRVMKVDVEDGEGGDRSPAKEADGRVGRHVGEESLE